MASIERTAYPRFRRVVTARELVALTPTEDEVAWARAHARTDRHLLALVLSLTCFQRLGYFPRADDVPAAVVEHVRRALCLADATRPSPGSETAKAQRRLVRERLGVAHDPERARAVASDAIRSGALVKNHPPDLINVALEMLVKASLELPAFSTLDEIAGRIRREVNTMMFERVGGRIALGDRIALDELLEVGGPASKSAFHRLKQVAGRASWSAFREQVAHLRWVDSLGDTNAWLDAIAESKIADFAGEAMAADAGVMRDVAPAKRTALLACMVYVARTRARDDLAEMFCKRMAAITKLAKTELDEIRERQAQMSEGLIGHYRGVLVCLDPRNPAQLGAEDVLRLARRTVQDAGGFERELADIEAVAAHHANNYTPLVARHRRRDRATMFAFVRVVELEATSADRSVLDAVAHALAHAHLTRDYIPDHVDGTVVDLSFASEQWQRVICDREHPGRLHRRHFEACVFTYLANELRTGDIAVGGSQAYANWAAQLLPREDCEVLLGEFCAEADCRPAPKRSATRCAAGSPSRPPRSMPRTPRTPTSSSTRCPASRRCAAGAQSPATPASRRSSRRSRSACPNARCLRSSRAPPTGWSGGAASDPRPDQIPSSPTRCCATS
ncbi:MAG: DUF4158 domain-containing protein [Actinobacteria bacterium]|nr:DUF4158 domain-containing protein [Actinomycetota bacterium]